MRRGVRLALDWGKARIGVAACDAEGTLAYPVETVRRMAAIARTTEETLYPFGKRVRDAVGFVR